MSGYVSPDKGTEFAGADNRRTIFSQTLLNLRDIGADLSPSVSVVVRKVAENISPSSGNDLDLSRAALERATYTGQETDLAGAISQFAKPLASADGAKVPRFHILVTDGVQSTKQDQTANSCAKGSDYKCVKTKIKELLDNGWAGLVLGVRSEFSGPVFSEIQPGRSTPYQSKKGDAASYRPFYLYLFSPDQAALDKLAEKIKSKTKDLVKDGAREYAFTANYANGVAKGQANVPGDAKKYIEARVEKGKDTDPPRLTLHLDPDTAKSNVGAKNLALTLDINWSNHALDAGTPQELGRLLRWELEALDSAAPKSAANRRFPELKILKYETDDKGRVTIELAAEWPAGVGDLQWRMYRLKGRLDTEQETPPWVAQWSTQVDTSEKEATRTLNLSSSLAGLWRNKNMDQQIVAEACLRVGP